VIRIQIDLDNEVNTFGLLKKKLPKHLYDLSIQGSHFDDSKQKDFGRVCKFLKKIKNAQRLKIALKSVNNQVLREVSKLFRSINRPSRVRIEASNSSSEVKAHDLKSLIWEKKLASLSVLEIKFDACTTLGEKKIGSLYKPLQKFKLLKKLQVHFKNSQAVQDGTVASLTKALKPLRTLNILDLNHASCCELTDKSLTSLSKCFSNLGSLSTVIMDMSHPNYITNNGLIEFFSKLGSEVKNLANLRLKFYSCPYVDDTVIESLSAIIKKKKTLKNLSLNFISCSAVTDQAINDLILSLESFESLATIYLEFSTADGITDRTLQSLAKVLQNNHRTLSKLGLFFTDCLKITSQGFECFAREIGRLGCLEFLILNIEGLTQINHDSFGVLAQSIQKLVRLSVFCPIFPDCKSWTDKEITLLSQAIANLNLLRYLSIFVGECTEITDDGFLKLCASLKHLQTLSNLTLNFSGADKISDKALETIPENIQNLNNLTTLGLVFLSCPRVNEENIITMIAQNLDQHYHHNCKVYFNYVEV